MNIVAVTGCENGMAQARMAAESLENAAEETGDEIKVEVRGETGTDSIMDEKDLTEAEAVILASEIPANPERFEGMAKVSTELQAAITDAEQLIKEVKRLRDEEVEDEIKYEREKDSGVVGKLKDMFS